MDMDLINEIEEMNEVMEIFPIRAEKLFFTRTDYRMTLSDLEFTRRFRLSKYAFNDLLSEVFDLIKPPTNRNKAVPAETRLMLVLRFMATGSMLLAVADFCGISEASASVFLKLVTEAICSLRTKYIKMATGDEVMRVMGEFYHLNKFPCVVGAIDCTHVRIQSPGGEHAENYRNRKGYFSVNVQTISDARLNIINVIARWPGATHDQTIYNNSVVKVSHERGDFKNGVILGDRGYSNTNFLLTPLRNPRTAAEVLYNESHIRTRNVVERQYGAWKRFPCLSQGLRINIDRVQAVVVATAILHNKAMLMKDDLPPEEYLPHPPLEVEDIEGWEEEEEEDVPNIGVRRHLLEFFQFF